MTGSGWFRHLKWAGALGLIVLSGCHKAPVQSLGEAAGPPPDVKPVMSSLQLQLKGYREIIILLADEKQLTPAQLSAASAVGQHIFHDDLDQEQQSEAELAQLVSAKSTGRYAALDTVLTYIESGDGLYDADRLAFREALLSLQRSLATDGSLPSVKLQKRIADDLDALAEVEHSYDQELRQIFNRFAPRGIELKREKWADYVAHLKAIRSRDSILRDYGVILPADNVQEAAVVDEKEQFGTSLPPKTVVLTFDDGPHRQYSDEIAAILKQYDAPAVFFEVGRNLGKVGPDGQVKLGPLADVAKRLQADGYVLGNHSYTHAQLSKLSGAPLNAEIQSTDTLLHAINPDRQPLFRFPYGARNHESMDAIGALHLHSIMWNVDSLDWADPIPNSVVDRVVTGVEHAGHGIVLFHDIHDRAVAALPKILERLSADGYQFAGWDGTGFSVKQSATAAPVLEKTAVTSGYAQSWAVVIGIDDYQHWPKLQYAVNDAEAIRSQLVQQFGFEPDHVLVLKDKDATRNGILALFEERLNHELAKDDRLLVFFAGHGATRQLSSGRTLGYIVPVDSTPDQFAVDAIPMTEIQDMAESLVAKHILFVMDACYSGLGLTRGAVQHSGNFLKDNARRIGRQMLTAGGADQMVADGGPNGHSVFTWAVLQGLAGKADLNGDGIITATELAAYVAPAVAGMSSQTPAFGSLPGSEGGEFVLELPAQEEFLTADSQQLPPEAIKVTEQLDAAHAAAPSSAPITVTDLQGKEQSVEVAKAVAVGSHKLAQLANDRGLALFRERNYEAAASEFTEALRQRPDFSQAANNLGFVYFKQNEFSEAARWFENAIKLDPARAIAYANLGDAYAQGSQPDKDKAKAAYQTYLALVPAGPSADLVRAKLAAL